MNEKIISAVTKKTMKHSPPHNEQQCVNVDSQKRAFTTAGRTHRHAQTHTPTHTHTNTATHTHTHTNTNTHTHTHQHATPKQVTRSQRASVCGSFDHVESKRRCVKTIPKRPSIATGIWQCVPQSWAVSAPLWWTMLVEATPVIVAHDSFIIIGMCCSLTMRASHSKLRGTKRLRHTHTEFRNRCNTEPANRTTRRHVLARFSERTWIRSIRESDAPRRCSDTSWKDGAPASWSFSLFGYA